MKQDTQKKPINGNYGSALRKLRTEMVSEVENLMTDDTIECMGGGLVVTTPDAGEMPVRKLFKEFMGEGVMVETKDGGNMEFCELNTDEMATVYEYIYCHYYQ